MNRAMCIVMTYERPEMLAECLRRVFAADGVAELDVVVLVDNHVDAPAHPETYEVLKPYREKAEIVVRETHQYYGPTMNALLGYREAFERRAPYLFFLEDDVMVGKDFFRWHLAVHEQIQPFASAAQRCPRWAEMSSHGPEDYILSSKDYANFGVCIPLKSLELIVRHSIPDYFSSLSPYLVRTFPHSWMGAERAEYDGLIHRVMESVRGDCAFPVEPRAFHAGYYGYHRLGREPKGTLAERISKFRELTCDAGMVESLNALGDMYPCVEVGQWDKVRLIQRLR